MGKIPWRRLACSHLDGHYTIFGEVISGLEVIDAIAAVATDRYDRPYEDVIINSIKPVIEVAPAPADEPVEEASEEERDRKELPTKESPANGIKKAHRQSNEESSKKI